MEDDIATPHEEMPFEERVGDAARQGPGHEESALRFGVDTNSITVMPKQLFGCHTLLYELIDLDAVCSRPRDVHLQATSNAAQCGGTCRV